MCRSVYKKRHGVGRASWLAIKKVTFTHVAQARWPLKIIVVNLRVCICRMGRLGWLSGAQLFKCKI